MVDQEFDGSVGYAYEIEPASDSAWGEAEINRLLAKVVKRLTRAERVRR
jgi:hypothetical protein